MTLAHIEHARLLKSQRTKGHAPEFAEWLCQYYGAQMVQHLQARNNLSRDDLEYLAEKAAALKDTRMQSCIATLIGWGDDERAELETFVAIALEVMRMTPPSRLRTAAQTVELRALMRDV